jgi:uncharacterized OsmC-like protein
LNKKKNNLIIINNVFITETELFWQSLFSLLNTLPNQIIMKSTVKWSKNLQSVIDNGRGHQVLTDMPEAKNGDNQGATAIELAAMSLAACIVTIFAIMATKMRIKFTQLEIELDSAKTDNDVTITKNEYVLKIKTNEPIDKIEKCLKHTLETCPVGIIFEKAGIPINGKIALL